MQETPRLGQADDDQEPLSADENDGSYYYDDAHGYERYIPADEDDAPEARPGDQKEEADTPLKLPDEDRDPS